MRTHEGRRRRQSEFFGRTFRSLRVRNVRLYFIGQLVSGCGTWMQTIGQLWLVLRITGSGTALGVTGALQFLPILVGGAWGGVVADRLDKRRLLFITQSLKSGIAMVLAVLTAVDAVELWMVYVLALADGTVNALDNPARRSFVMELAGRDHVANAVSLNSALLTSARVVGPAIAGFVIATLGIAPCFFANSASYWPLLIALVLMKADELHVGETVARAPGQVREGLRYALSDPEVRLPLLVMAVVGTLAYNFRVVLPLLADRVYDGGAGTFGLLYSFMSVGSLAGALFTASRTQISARFSALAALAFGTMILAASATTSFALAGLMLVGVGAGSSCFSSTTQATLQLRSDPRMRGRVMALYSVVFLGSTPIGSPAVGWIAQHFGPRSGFAVGGIATVAAALVALAVLARRESDVGAVTATP